MKKVVINAFACASICAFLSCGTIVPVLATEAGMPFSITVEGEGKKLVKPDIATVSVGVVSQAAAASDALSANSKAMADLFKNLESLGIAKRDMQTQNFSVSPEYKMDSGHARKISGYTARNNVSVKVRNLSQVGTLLDQLVQLGANEIHGLRFSSKAESKILDDARKEAVEDARRKATIYADAAGVKLGRVLYVTEGNSYRPTPRIFAARAAGMMDSSPIAEGEEELRVSSTVVFAIQ
jgi:uncharacterized protein YggE